MHAPHTRRNAMWKVLLTLAPIALAVWIMVSRTREYWHNFDDVLTGGAIGLVMAFLFYRIHFPCTELAHDFHPHHTLDLMSPAASSPTSPYAYPESDGKGYYQPVGRGEGPQGVTTSNLPFARPDGPGSHTKSKEAAPTVGYNDDDEEVLM